MSFCNQFNWTYQQLTDLAVLVGSNKKSSCLLDLKLTILTLAHIQFFVVVFPFIDSSNIPAHISLKNCFDLLASRAPRPSLSHHAKSFKASVASLAQPPQPHQPPAATHNSACPLGWASREGSRARTPRTPKHPEQLEVPSSHPASQQNNQNTENL